MTQRGQTLRLPYRHCALHEQENNGPKVLFVVTHDLIRGSIVRVKNGPGCSS